MALKRADFVLRQPRRRSVGDVVRFKRPVSCCCLLGAGVLGHSLGTFRYGVLGQFTGQQKTNSGLDLPTGDRRPLVVVSQARSFGRNALEDVVDERVHYGHGLARDTGIRMDLLQYFVNVHRVALLPAAFLLLVILRDVLLRLSGLLRCFTARLRWHVVWFNVDTSMLSLRESHYIC